MHRGSLRRADAPVAPVRRRVCRGSELAANGGNMSQCEPRQRAENALESDCRFSRQIETAGRRRVAGECHDESSTCSNTDAPRSGSTASGREQSESPDSTLNRKEQIHGAPIWLSSATCRIFWNRLPIWRWGALCARMDGGSLFLQPDSKASSAKLTW